VKKKSHLLVALCSVNSGKLNFLKTQVTLVDGLVPDLPAAEVTTEPVNEAQPTEPAAE